MKTKKELEAALKESNDEIEVLMGHLKEARKALQEEYNARCEDVDYFNNNTPNVGISIDYRSRPPIPKALEIINRAIAD